MFAALTLERDPLKFEDLPAMFLFWVQDAGGFAAAGLAVYMLYALAVRRRLTAWTDSGLYRSIFLFALLGAAASYALLGVLQVPDLLRSLSSSAGAPPSPWRVALQQALPTVGGAFALLGVGLPFLDGVRRLRWRRIWALARLSFKEAIRRRVLWAFAALLVVFLFAGWFIDTKPEHQVRTYVSLVSLTMAILLLTVAAFLASFSIPTDIRSQTIHTVLTKPVEPFEVVVGRFLGYTMLMTLILVVASGLSLLYVLRGIDPDAAEESLKARVPLYGELFFAREEGGRLIRDQGESVGREWEYRSYIPGPSPPSPTKYAVWDFFSLPSRLADRDTVRCEYTFDIFRTTKGRDDTPVACTFLFETWRFRGRQAEYNNERNRLRQEGKLSIRDIDAQLAEKYGYYEAASVPIADYHTLHVDIPASLIRNALEPDPAARQELESAGQPIVPLRVRVRCEDRTQYVGMAKYDLYLRADDHTTGADKLWFSWNFFKGAVGLWCWLCLVIGLAVALSTYLSGVISFLCAGFLFLAGFFQDFIQKLAMGMTVGGGPMESMLRLLRGTNLVVPLEDTAATRVALGSDNVSRLVLRCFLYVLPDVDRFALSDYVAEGFSISVVQLFFNLLLLIGYLLPWAVLAYYLMRSREIAGPT